MCVATDFLPVRQQSYRPSKHASSGRLKWRKPSNGPHCILWYNIHLISLSKFNLPLIGSFYVTHAARALQSHDLSGKGIKPCIQTYFFDHTRTRRASPDESSAPCRSQLRDSINMKDETTGTLSFIPTRRIWTDDYGGQMINRDLVGLKFLIFVLQVSKNPEKTTPRKPVSTGDWTRVRCVTGAHATACSTAANLNSLNEQKTPGHVLEFLCSFEEFYVTYTLKKNQWNEEKCWKYPIDTE